MRRQPAAAFYLPLSRGWELLLGTLLTYFVEGSDRLPRWLSEVLAVTGVLLIIASIHFYSSATHFPGLMALLPCTGAALLILCGAGNQSMVNRILCWRPLVFVGLISYSLYLWHWPVIVFVKMGVLPVLPTHQRPQTILIILVSMVLATLSWHFVERPFRSGWPKRLPPVRVLSGFAGACIVLFTLCTTLPGLPSPFPPEALEMSKYANQVDDDGFRKGTCYIGDPFSFADFHARTCLALDHYRPNLLILGDSHAAAIYPGLSRAFPEINFLQASAQGCKPLRDSTYSADCAALMRFIYQDFLPKNRVDGILLVGRWLDASDLPKLRTTIAYLKALNEDVLLVGPSPEYRISLPRLIAYSITRHDPSLPELYQANDLFALDSDLSHFAEVTGAGYLSPLRLLCRDQRCVQRAAIGSRAPLLFDSNHFTTEGAELLAEQLRRERGVAFWRGRELLEAGLPQKMRPGQSPSCLE